jgi:hypothetical protein
MGSYVAWLRVVVKIKIRFVAEAAPHLTTQGAEERATIDGFLFGDNDRVMVLYRDPSSIF